MSEERVDLEKALREALRTEPAPFGFAERVVRRARERKRRQTTRTWMAIAAMVVLAALIGVDVQRFQQERQEQQQVAARKAGHDLMVALRITGSKLHSTNKMIRRRMNGA